MLALSQLDQEDRVLLVLLLRHLLQGTVTWKRILFEFCSSNAYYVRHVSHATPGSARRRMT
jgi:hypothetical protein